MSQENNQETNHVEQTAEITLNGSVDEVFPMFDPINESLWAPHWKIERVHPREGSVEQGMIFKPVIENHDKSLWIINKLDKNEHQIEYLAFTAGHGLKRISIDCDSISDTKTRASITYEITALSPESAQELTEYTPEHHNKRILHWESLINAVLESGVHADAH